MNPRIRLLTLLAASLLTLPLVPRTADAAVLDTAGGFDGNPATTERINEGDPVHAAVDISQIRFPDGAAHVVLSRDDTFADALAGSGLTGDGPLLYTQTDRLHPETRSEIDRVLDAGDTVYLLGGTSALAPGVATTLTDAGYRVERLAGPSRIDTAVAVANEVRSLHPGDDVLLARADSWADSVSAGGVAAATNTPVLVTSSASLSPAVAWWLAADQPATTTLLGGTAALSTDVERSVPNPKRVSGIDRTATAAAVADQLWDATDQQYVVAQGLADDSWTFGFAAAGLAADADAPILLVTDEVTDATADLVSTCGEPAVELEVVGDGQVVPAALREQLDAADGLACGPDGALVYPDDLTTFPACTDLLAHIKESALERVGPYGLGGFGDIGRPMPIEDGEGIGGAPDAPQTSDDADSPTSEVASGTNVQEEGVDEPDAVKTNGVHAFVVAQGDLQVVDVQGTSPTVVATLDLPDDGSHELLLSGNRLLVVTRQHTFFAFDEGADAAFVPAGGGEAKTTLTYVDVSVATSPTITSSLTMDGDYRSARMIGSVARLVVQTDPGGLPFVFPSDGTAAAEQSAAEHNRGVVEGSSLDDWLPTYSVDGGADAALLDCADVRRPPLFSGLGALSVVTIDLAGDIEPTSSAAVLASGETVYASADRLYVTTGRWDWEPDSLDSGVTTEIHAFDIASPTATSYVGSGAVSGYILNSFALSEHEGNLRVAATLDPPWTVDGEQVGSSQSAVHVLAEQGDELVEIGKVDGLGVGERIYAVRYFGDVAAVVTFRQVDPLYLLDLSNPTSPRVTGELKIPGFSAYLHRVDATHLLGVGSDADAEGMVTGAAVSLFDISDVTAPRLVDKLTFADAYTPVQYDHHAFLHWPATGLAVFPLEEYGEQGPGFQGAIGIDVAAAGLTEAGRTTHVDDVPSDGFYPMISRSFVANGSLFTVSEGGIEQADLTDLDERAFARF